VILFELFLILVTSNQFFSSQKWSCKFLKNNVNSVLYFGDDDNTYDLRLFEEIRKTKKVSVFPVAYVGKQGISSPGVYFINILHEAFMLVDPESLKKD